jgi:uncharacterized membrane protein
MDFVYFLGRFHVLALHLPIGLVLGAVLLDHLALKPRFHAFSAASTFLWGTAALSAIGTVALGYMHYLEGGFASAAATVHMALGTSIAVVSTAVWIVRLREIALPRLAEHGVAAVLVVLVVLTGHYGGNLTHGPTYLLEYAPSPIRALAGLGPRRPPVTDLAAADVFLDVVHPMLRSRCSNCHSDDRQRGGLNLSSYESLRRGGETGTVVTAGNAQRSELYRRITLAEDDEERMPAEGKTPLTEEQTEIIGWWIDAGAPASGLLAEFDYAPIEPQLMAALGLGGSTAARAESSAEPVPPDESAVQRLADAGFHVRALSMSDPRLSVSLTHSPGESLSEAQLAALLDTADQIAELNLRSSVIDDAQLERLAPGLTGLTHLWLAENAISDEGIAALSALPNLEYLNVTGNADITDTGVAALAELPALERVHLWRTSATEAGVDALVSRKPDIVADLGVAFPTDER